jgi:hypothetical protein
MNHAKRRRLAKAQAKAERLRAAGLVRAVNDTRYIHVRRHKPG